PSHKCGTVPVPSKSLQKNHASHRRWGPPTFWHQGNVGGPFRPRRSRPGFRVTGVTLVLATTRLEQDVPARCLASSGRTGLAGPFRVTGIEYPREIKCHANKVSGPDTEHIGRRKPFPVPDTFSTPITG